jgi:hypothetical protein
MDLLSNFLRELVLEKPSLKEMEKKGLEKALVEALVDSGVGRRTACTAAILPAFLNESVQDFLKERSRENG